ncbi:MAG: DUF11 domain-containing protein, partial [Chloroflexi bacterium]
MNTKLRRLTGALTLAIAIMLAVVAAPAFAQGPVDLSVTKTVDNPTPASGDTVVYTINVTNNSTITDATGVVLTDNLPTGVTYVSDDSGGAYNTTTGEWAIGSLISNTTVALNITATVDPAADGTVVTNSASVTGAETDPNAANDSASAAITVTNPPPPPEADLGVSKAVDNATPASGDTIVYTVQVTNNGPNDATGVVLTDTLPAGVTWVSDDSGGAYNTTTGEWAIGSLVSNTTVALNITATVDPATHGTVVTNSANVGGAETDPNTANDSASVDITVTNIADLAVSKSVDNAAPPNGSTIVYTVIITNNGPHDATGVTVNDLLPAGVVYVSDDSLGAYDSVTGDWTVGNLANGASATLNITADVTAANGTLVTNTAAASGTETDPNAANDSASVDITVTNLPAADLGVTKTIDNAAPATGGVVKYTVTVTNNGPDTATGVVVTDTLPAGDVSWVSDDSNSAYNTTTGEWAVGSLGNGASATLNITATVNAANGAVVTNTATVGGNEIDPNAANDSASVDFTVTNQADLGVTKTVDNAAPAPGSVVTYTITVTNNGPDAATGVVVSDTLPAGVSFGTATATTGTYDNNTGDWTVGPLANGASATLNITATVTAAEGDTVVNTAEASAVEGDPNPANDSASASFSVPVPTYLITVTVTNAGGAEVPGQKVQVYTVDTNGITTATTISDTTDISGTVTFDLTANTYKFYAGDTFGSYSSAACDVPTCTAASLFMYTPVEITVVDTTGADVAGQDVYVFDNANVYQNISGTTNISGSVSFDLNSNNYLFWAYDANGAAYGSVPAPCTTPDCTTAIITMPVFGMVDVTVTDGVYPVGGQNVQVYTVDTNGITSATTISAPTNISGTVSFTLAEDAYQFGGVMSGTTYLSATCNVPTCTTSSLVLAAVSPVTVTVHDSVGNPLENQVVTVFDDVAGLATPVTGTTNISGTVEFNLPAGNFRFTADGVDGITYFSTSGVDPVCTLPGCTEALITLPAASVTLPAATCTET